MTTSIAFIFDQEVELSPTEVWPNRDVPDSITAEAVMREVHKAGGIERILQDWNLLDGMDLTVVVSNDGERSTMTYQEFKYELRKKDKKNQS